MNHEAVVAVLPDSKEETKSIKEIAQAKRIDLLLRRSGKDGAAIGPRSKQLGIH
jgi:hypothetical protein